MCYVGGGKFQSERSVEQYEQAKEKSIAPSLSLALSSLVLDLNINSYVTFIIGMQ